MDDLPPAAVPPEPRSPRLLDRARRLADGLRPPGDRLRRLAEGARAAALRLWRGRRPMVLAAAGVAVALLAFTGAAWSTCGFGGCPGVERLRSYQPGKASRLLDRHGRFFAELRPVEGATVPLPLIPRHVRDAFLAVEDQRFYGHDGVDWRRVVGAALVNLRSLGMEQGFSTISMQLARNLFPDRIKARERTLARKFLEVRVAYEIEDRFDKDEILELYLSHIYFGNGARGVEAAARHYFGTGAARLTLSQAALLAGLIRGPSIYDPRRHPERARERRDLVLRLMEEQGRVPAATATASRAAPLGVVRRRPSTTSPGLAPYFVEEVRRQLEDRLGQRVYDETLSVTTTLDVGLQQAAEEELARQLKAVESGSLGRFTAPRYSAAAVPMENGTTYLQGAVVALEVGSGDVLAWVGGRDFQHSRFDRVKSSQRQTGSAFKPFVYAAALREGHYLSERVSDEPLQVRLDRNRVWEPQNFDRVYEGAVTVRDALVRSRNVPTVRLATDVGLADVAEVAREAGIRSEMDQTPAMPLGTVAVSPLELATAYTAFAGLGEVAAPRTVLLIAAQDGSQIWRAEVPRTTDRVMDPGVAYLVTNVLEEAVERGTGTAVRASGYAGPAAGKTGTTNSATDTWFVGYTPRLVAAVWMGFDEPRPIMGVATGGRLAAPVWGRMMARVARRMPAAEWAVPASVVQASIDPESGLPLADGCRPYWGEAYREIFLRGSMPRTVCPDRGEVSFGDWHRPPSDEDHPWHFEIWPDDDRYRSRPAPPPEYEEAEEWRRERRQRAR
ncbi:MAG TPA: PBP1A family penicillin-binding protein, partial [Vicinamibacteria bacterium]|nr:PBP1A family penicillin-binding protein [Vicinamibacteria bacterium]